MNPRDRRLRLRRTTVRDLIPQDATLARGGNNVSIPPQCVVFDTKDPSQNPCLPYPTWNCHQSTLVHTECAATACITECLDTFAYSCADSCWDCDSMFQCP
jgi:hypothetical protein